MFFKFLRNGTPLFRKKSEAASTLLSDDRINSLAKFSLALTVITACILAGTVWKVASDSAEGEKRILHTREVLDAIFQIKFNTLNIEYNTQGLRFTGELERIVDRNVAINARTKALAQLAVLITDSTEQNQRFTTLKEVVAQRAAIAKRIEELVLTEGSQAATAYVRTVPLKETRERVYHILAEMEAHERVELENRGIAQAIAHSRVQSVSLAVAMLLVFVLISSYFQTRRHLQRMKVVQNEVAKSEQNLAITLMSIGDAVLTTDDQAHITRINEVAELLTGWPSELALGQHIGEVYRTFDERTRLPTVSPVIEVVSSGLVSSHNEHSVLIARDGSERPVSDSAAPIHNVDGQIRGVVLVFRDVTNERQIANAALQQNELLEQRVARRTLQLQESEKRLARVLEGANLGYWDWNLQTNAFNVSAIWETMLGYNPGEINKDPDNWPQLFHPEDLQRVMSSIERHLNGESISHEVEIRVKTKEGAWKWILTSGRIVSRDDRGEPLMMSGTHTDISQIKAHEAELDKVANFDALTRLPNRRLLLDRLNQSILLSDRSGKSTAICFLDLDGFKPINDQFGHALGDQVLIGISQHLSAVMRAGDTLARLGGDEFVLLLSGLGSIDECTQILDRVMEASRLPILANGQDIVISASIGVTLYPSDNSECDMLLRHADMAMYLAKQGGKNRYQLFDTEIDRIAQIQSDFLAAMSNALQNNEFILFYQPKIDLQSDMVIGAEALVRWQRPNFGLLSPIEFLSHLNGSHLEAVFGEWVMNTALHQMRDWKVLGMKIRVSVNISAKHLLRPGFYTNLKRILSSFPDIDASDLELEVLESAELGDMQQAIEVIESCTKLGVRFALDDFGTGYSSLTYLRKLPVHTLKIDQSFVIDMLHDPDDLRIVRSIIEMADVFSRQVVAEGVETKEHGAALLKLGCYQVQGYGIARPMHPEHFPAWCDAWKEMEGPWLGATQLNPQA